MRPLASEYRWTAALLALLIAFKLWLSAVFPFTGDEAYFTIWGLKPDLGYYDHPPMVGWLLALLTRVSMQEWVLRLPATLAPVLIAFVMFVVLKRSDARKALYAAAAFLLVPINVWNVFITTDAPLVLFSFFSAFAWWRSIERRSLAWHAASGVLLGLAILSKYFAALLALVYVFHALLAPRPERSWNGLGVALACAAPFALFNVWWNYEHCWANLMFNLYNRHGSAGLSWNSPLLFVLIAAYTLSPIAAWQLVRRRLGFRAPWQTTGSRFFILAAGIPFAVFALLSVVRPVGLHWVLAFIPFFFIAAALALSASQLRRSVVYLGLFSLAHVAAILAVAALPLETWKNTRQYDGLVFHFRIREIVAALERHRPEFVLAADGYSPAVTASYYSGQYLFVFGTASSHARHDDLLTDFRSLEGKNILIFRKNPPQDDEYRPYFRSVEFRTLQLSGATFHLVLGRGFDYAAYRSRVLAEVRDRYYRIPPYLPQGGCAFCERYFGAYCPVRT